MRNGTAAVLLSRRAAIEAARAAVARGATLADVPALVLAGSTTGELGCHVRAWTLVWEEGPLDLPDGDEATQVEARAGELAQAYLRLAATKFWKPTGDELERIRATAAARAPRDPWRQVDGATLEVALQGAIRASREDRVRIATADVVVAEQLLRDALRLAWASSRDGRR